MRLLDLAPRFVRFVDGGSLRKLDVSFADAHGLLLDCPLGDGHKVLVWFADRGVPAEARPAPRWAVTGTGYADLTLAPSIDLSRGSGGVPVKCGSQPGWHGFIRGGEVA